MSHTDIDDYVPSPRSTDPADIIAEKDIAIRWLLDQIDQAATVIQDRERTITELYQQL
ncbi:MAG: hypothetical protein HYZ39_19225 [Mycolicibacterium cosmeticum]|nr:hypothetical protein [Mycolicibacterium cosmeticum]